MTYALFSWQVRYVDIGIYNTFRAAVRASLVNRIRTVARKGQGMKLRKGFHNAAQEWHRMLVLQLLMRIPVQTKTATMLV